MGVLRNICTWSRRNRNLTGIVLMYKILKKKQETKIIIGYDK